MNNDEAKFRLRAYRPEGQDAGDPTMSDALRQAERDPALRAWLAREQAFDAAVTSRMRTIEPPSGLREAILAGARMAPRRAVWFRSAWLAVAAAIAVTFTLSAVWWQRRGVEPLAAFTQFAIDDLRHGQHGGHGEAEGELQMVLANPATHLAGFVPIDFTRLAATGCRKLHFSGRDVLEICFQRAGAEFHFYILPRGDLPVADKQYLLEDSGVGAVAWNDARYVYAIIGKTSPETIRRLL